MQLSCAVFFLSPLCMVTISGTSNFFILLQSLPSLTSPSCSTVTVLVKILPTASELTFELRQRYGPEPVFAVITPYVLATILFTTWKFSGVLAPLHYHFPREILERTMLRYIAPTTCVLVLAPSTEPENSKRCFCFLIFLCRVSR